jgi:CelD/BcsL family acetyltransferase involved in cellulose biosynthesis
VPANLNPPGIERTAAQKARALVARRVAFDSIAAEPWDALVDRTPAATPFSRHCVQRAWWDAYGAAAHDETLVIVDEEPGEGSGSKGAAAAERIVGIAPLMHRHELEPGDVAAHTALRHETEPLPELPATTTAVFFGASYHADYATVLADPADLRAVCDVVEAALAAQEPSAWDVVDLRRLRKADPAADALTAAFEREATDHQWTVTREQEDVCPVLTLPQGVDFEGYLDTLDKKERHEIRRKIRRAEAAGEVVLERSADAPADLDAFVDLHQKRWGADGLFPPTEGGAASRRFFAGLFDCAPGLVDLSFLTVGGRRIAAAVTMDDGDSVYYYNAGVETDARELSPGVVMVACLIKRAMELGRRRLDFMRGNESYKYAWGAQDEPIERLLVRRSSGGSNSGVAEANG